MAVVIQSFFLHQYFHQCFHVGMRIRTAIIAAVYKVCKGVKEEYVCVHVCVVYVHVGRTPQLNTFLRVMR